MESNNPTKSSIERQFSLSEFLEYFPVIDLPITLGEETIHIFSEENRPLPEGMIQQFIFPLEPGLEEEDDMVEFIACFQLPEQKEYTGLVYWKGELLNYQFTLITFTKAGAVISKQTLAGTVVYDNQIFISVATIDSDLEIKVITGGADVSSKMYNPSNSKVTEFEIMANGEVIAV